MSSRTTRPESWIWRESPARRALVVLDDAEVDDDLVRDMTEVLTSMCARLYGRRSARRRAEKALEAAAS